MNKQTIQEFRDALRSARIGDESLSQAFWIYGLAIVIAIQVLLHVVLGKVVPAVNPWLGWLIHIAAVWAIIYLTYWGSMTIWRCAWNTEWAGWGHIARWLVLASHYIFVIQYFLIAFSPN